LKWHPQGATLLFVIKTSILKPTMTLTNLTTAKDLGKPRIGMETGQPRKAEAADKIH
jgi:hypothetical protein